MNQPHRGFGVRAFVVVVGIGLGFLGAACSRSDSVQQQGRTGLRPPPLPTETPRRGAGACLPMSFAELAEAAMPAVVQVKVFEEISDPKLHGNRVREGVASAFVYDPKGLLLTNQHVVAAAVRIQVKLSDGRELDAAVVGADPLTDVAVLRVAAHDLPSLELGDSDALRVGDWVVAIGSPFALSQTVSAGIVSAKRRTRQDVAGLGEQGGYYNLVQTDASINPGNSGGPLLDLSGRVVGINTAMRLEGNRIGFAIPANMVKELVKPLVAHGRLRRSALGVRVDPLTDGEGLRLGCAKVSGVVVRAVHPGGAAEHAGIRSSDVITSFGGETVESPERLRWIASMAGVGSQVRIAVCRAGHTVSLDVTLGELASPAPTQLTPTVPMP